MAIRRSSSVQAPVEGDYDVAVVGAGFGGLGAALRCAEHGARVLLLESLTYPGGCASTFMRGGASFDYQTGDAPVLAVRLQEMFGQETTPMIADVPVVLHLLSPAHRPMQVTTDLASFWAHTYPQVRGELAGRYPRHHWPDDPLTAAPTNRAKRRRR